MRKYAEGFTLVEMMIVVLVIGLLAGIAIVFFPGASKSVNAGSLATTIDGAAQKISNWGAQKQNNFYTENAKASTLGNLTDIAKDIAPLGEGYKWSDENLSQQDWLKKVYANPKSYKNVLFAGYCGDRSEQGNTDLPGQKNCANIVGCMPYFSNGETMCLDYLLYPRGSEQEGANIKSVRKVYCVDATGSVANCKNAIYTDLINGKSTGNLQAGGTKSCGSVWPTFPNKGGGKTPTISGTIDSLPCSDLKSVGGGTDYEDKANCQPASTDTNCFNYVDPTKTGTTP